MPPRRASIRTYTQGFMLPLDTHAQSASAVTRRGLTEEQICKVRVQIDPAGVSVPRLCRASAAAGLYFAGRTGLLSDDAGRWTINFSAAARRASLLPAVGMMVLFVCRYGWIYRCAAGMTHRVKRCQAYLAVVRRQAARRNSPVRCILWANRLPRPHVTEGLPQS